MDLFAVFVIAMSVTMVLVPPLGRVAARFNVLDRPSERKVHSKPVPRIGGVAIAVGAMLPLILFLNLSPTVQALLIGSVLMLAFGLWDDRVDLDYRLKLLGQLLAVAVLTLYGDVRIESITLDAREPLPEWLSWPLTALFLLGVTNAINLADGLDGLAGGTTLLCFCAIALLAYSGGNLTVVTIAVAIIGAILGFLRFNTYPARIFMGDGGSQFLGLNVGALAILATQNPESPVSAALPLLLLALPILDTLMVMTQRFMEGRSPFSADRNHVHHRLLALGFDHHEAVVTIYVLQVAAFLLAYFLRFESDLLIAGLFAAFALAVIGTLQVAHATGWRVRGARPANPGSALTRHLQWLLARHRLPQWALLFIGLGVTAYSLFVVGRARTVTPDLAWLAAGLLALVVVRVVLGRHRDLTWLEKAVIYVAAMLVVYLDQKNAQATSLWSLAPFIALAVAVLLRFRLSGDRRFEVTPLDVIVVFVALVVPNLPGGLVPDEVAAGLAKIIVLLYAIETVLAAPLRWPFPRAVAVGVLATLAVRGLWL